MLSSKTAIDTFFESSVWGDIENMLKGDVKHASEKLEGSNIIDIHEINTLRGELRILRNMVNLKEILLGHYEAEDEEEEQENG